jgi:Flagellar biosynthesis protein, FliO
MRDSYMENKTAAILPGTNPGNPVSIIGWIFAKISSRISSQIRSGIRFGIDSFSANRSRVDNVLALDGKLSLGPKKTLFLVNCKGRQFLVATGAETIASMVEVLPVETVPAGDRSSETAEEASTRSPKLQKRGRPA